jgi:hypothetical protein
MKRSFTVQYNLPTINPTQKLTDIFHLMKYIIILELNLIDNIQKLKHLLSNNMKGKKKNKSNKSNY